MSDYATRQGEWINDNNVKRETMLYTTRMPEDGEDGWTGSNTAFGATEELCGRWLKCCNARADSRGIGLVDPETNKAEWWPYFCLSLAEETKPHDLVIGIV